MLSKTLYLSMALSALAANPLSLANRIRHLALKLRNQLWPLDKLIQHAGDLFLAHELQDGLGAFPYKRLKRQLRHL